jgi:tetratricopeptide (TPR) repeat protein
MGSRRFLIIIVIVGCIAAAYFPVYRAGFIWDDEHYVTDNANLRTAQGLADIWLEPAQSPQYYPLTFTTFWLEYHLWDSRPAGYHVVNIGLHALGAILFGLVLEQLEVPAAWLAATIFALHPIHVESVAWIAERKNVLSGVFYWSSFLAYWRFAKNQELSRATMWYSLSLTFYVCALLSKTITCSLPAVLLLVLWWKEKPIQRRRLLALVPFFLLGAVFGLTTALLEKTNVGAHGDEWAFSWLERWLIAGRALWFYAGKLVWPVQLTFIYPRWQIDSTSWSQYLYPLTAVSAVLILWFARRRLGAGPFVAVLCFVGTMLPALGFFNVYPMRFSFVADHFQYLASAFLIALGAAVSVRCGPPLVWTNRAGILTLAVVPLLGALTYRQTLVYENSFTLWNDTLAKNPACWMAHNNLGTLYLAAGQWSRARGQFESALRDKPNHFNARYNLGLVAAKQQHWDEAIRRFRETLRERPDHVEALTDLGLVYLELHDHRQARQHLMQAIAHNPQAWRWS